MERSLVLGLEWLLKCNPYVNWRRRLLKIWWRTPNAELKQMLSASLGKRAKIEMGTDMRECPWTPKEYRGLWDVFSERRLDTLSPHRPIDCSIEILPGAKLPKPKLYSITPRA